ncbi:hypothetical protein BC940DRAFT_294355 [Gongronella butleri]|nr:hypothetical protein BC940DRAFT_294355 [Gongronella butleri]
MNPCVKRAFVSTLLQSRSRVPATASSCQAVSVRFAHTAHMSVHRFSRQRNVPNKLLQAVRKGDQQAVWTQYSHLHDNDQVQSLTTEQHSMALRALGLQHMTAYGPDEILAIKERLLIIWNEMKRCGHSPDIRDYNHMLGFAGRSSDWVLCQQVWTELQDHSSGGLFGLLPNVFSYNAYMQAAIQCNQPAKAITTFNSMLQTDIRPNRFSYNSLIDAYGALGDLAEVDRLFDRHFSKQAKEKAAKKKLSTLLHPHRDASTALGRQVATLSRYASPIASSSSSSSTQHLQQPSVDTFMSLIDAHGRNGNVAKLMSIYNDLMPEYKVAPTLAVFNGLIRWHCAQSDIDTARQLFFEMDRKGVKPSVVTFHYLFRHEALKARRPGVAEKLVDLMHQAYNLQPLQSMYRQLIKVHNRHKNREHEVDRLVRSYQQVMKN